MWPAVVSHGFANAIGHALLSPDVVVVDNLLVYAARPEGLITLPLLVAAAAVLYLRWGRPEGSESAVPR